MYKPTPSLPGGRVLGDEARGDKATRLGINSPTVNMIMLRFIFVKDIAKVVPSH